MATTLKFGGTGGVMQGNAGASNVECELDGVFSLDGTGDYFNIANQTNLQDIWTSGGAISLWIKPGSDSSNFDRIIDKDLWKLRLNNVSAGKAGLQLVREWSTGDASWETAAILDLGYWHHVAVVYDDDAVANDATIYVNGIAIANASETNQSSGSASATTTAMTIGAKFDGSANFFHGSIADVRIYSSELTEAQIRKLASRMFIDNRLVRTDDTRLAHWHLNVKPSGSLLTAAVNSSTTTIPVDRGLDFTDNDYQHILIEDEIMRITGISSNDLTVDNRSTASNRCGTTAASHDDNDVVYIVGMEDLSSNNYPVVLVGDLTTPSGDIDWHSFSVDVMECADTKIDIAKNVNGTEFASSTTATDFTAEASHSILVGMTLQIGSEKMYVSGVSTNTITVTRGIGGTTAANQANGSDIYVAPVNHIQGTTTITSGTFNIGKTTSFNADSKYIQFTDTSAISGISEMVVSAWFKCTGGSGDRVIVQKDTEYRIALNSSNYIEAYIYESGGSARTTTHSVDMEDNKWHHVAIRWNGANCFLYVDGKFSTYTAGGTAAVNNNSTALMIGLDYGTSNFFVGKIKDVRIYDHDMDNFQIKALAQGSNLEVPSVWYPMDDDAQTTTATILNQGVGGTITCGAENAGYVNSTYDTDGTLTLGNGTVRLPRGTLELTDITGTTGRIEHNDGIIDVPNSSWGSDVTGLTAANERALHTINIPAGSTYLSLDSCDIDVEDSVTGSGGLTMYHNSTCTLGTDSSSGTWTAVARLWTTYSSSTIQGKSSLYPVDFNPSSILYTNPYDGNTINFANVNSDADLTLPDAFRLTCTGDCEFDAITVDAASEGMISTFDSISSNTSGTAWTDGTYTVTDGTAGVTGADGSGAQVRIVISSGAAAVTIRPNGQYHGTGYQVNSSWSVPDALLGNNGGPALTFDVATLCTGRFDMNGQRVKISGVLNNAGVVDYDGLLDAYNINDDGTANNTTSCNMMLSGIGSGDVTLDLQTGAYKNIMINTRGSGKYENCPILNATNLIVAEGQLEMSGSAHALTNCRIGRYRSGGDGAELDLIADADQLDLAGNFSMSGGLFGASGLTLDGTSDYMRAGTYGSANNFTGWSNNNLTVECWYQSSSSAQAGIMASFWGSGSKHFILYREANGSIRCAVNADGGSTYVQTNTLEAGVSRVFQDADDGKWHHYAMTYDGANLKLYIDGALYANRAVAVTLDNGANGIFTIGAYHTGSNDTHSASAGLIGDVARCSVWNHTLTESEIRTLMFYDYAEMDADSDFNTPQSDLKGWYQFDEGTSTSVDNMQGTTNVDGLLVNGAWFAGGNFDRTAVPNLNFTKSGVAILDYIGGQDVGDLTVASGCTLSLRGHQGDGGDTLDIYGTLTMNGTKVTAHAFSGNANIKFREGGKTLVINNPSTGLADLYRVTMHHSSGINILPACTLKRLEQTGNGTTELTGALIVGSSTRSAGAAAIDDLKVSAGKLDVGSSGDSITCTNDILINGGHLDADASSSDGNITAQSITLSGGTFDAPSHGTVTTTAQNVGGWCFYQSGGTFNANAGTLKVDFGAAGAGHFNFHQPHNLTIEMYNDTSSTVYRDYTGNTVTITGDLTIVEGFFKGDNSTDTLTVEGNVSIQDGGTLNQLSDTRAVNLGSITISDGGTYNATSGLTTITSRTSGGYSWYAPNAGSIFNHNNGTVKVTLEDWGGADETYWHGTGWYNLEMALNSASRELRFDDVSGGGLTVYNNFTLSEGRFRFNAGGDSVTVYGLTKMSGGQYGNTGTAPSGTHNYLGGITMIGGAWQTTSGTLNTSGLIIRGGTFA